VQYSSLKWPCRIGVISDTHIGDVWGGDTLIAALQKEQFHDVDLILHAGDMVDPEILSLFTTCPVLAVNGNMDPVASGLPMRRVIATGPFRLGLIHGWGSPRGLEQRLLREFATENIDCLVYGHSHIPDCRRQDGRLLFNPGSPTDRRGAPFHSVGLLEVNDTIQGRIIALD